MYHGGIERDISLLAERSVSAVLADLKVKPSTSTILKAELEIPKERRYGDLSTNIAMKTARASGRSPVDLAKLIKARMEGFLGSSHLKDSIGTIDVVPPGFINISFSKKYLRKVLLEIKRRKDNFGRSGIGRGAKLQIEFVSTNPTGPLTIAHGRQAAIGDSLANILKFLGYRVIREYYLNDEGTQMNILGSSIKARYLEIVGKPVEFPADGYRGSYVTEIARDFKKRYGRRFLKAQDIDPFREFGLRWILKDIKKDLKRFGVKFDVWYSQKALRKSGKIDKAIALLKDKGYVYEKDGAVWFRSTDFGDDKDRVIKKSDASYTYLAPDIAYHLEKYRRGFRKIIDMWGPDHHGYIPRMKAAMQALGFPKDSIDILIVQLATLYRFGQAVSMSTRTGEFITLREVMDEVGKDVARFCFISRRLSSHLDFDLDIAKKESMENPVYYIQYAHARIHSILRHGKSAHPAARFDSRLLREPEELEILRLLEQFPMIVISSGKSLEPYVIMQYLQDVATVFHCLYTKHRVVSADPGMTKARLVLVDCVRIILANGLRLLGVSLPKEM